MKKKTVKPKKVDKLWATTSALDKAIAESDGHPAFSIPRGLAVDLLSEMTGLQRELKEARREAANWRHEYNRIKGSVA